MGLLSVTFAASGFVLLPGFCWPTPLSSESASPSSRRLPPVRWLTRLSSVSARSGAPSVSSSIESDPDFWPLPALRAWPPTTEFRNSSSLIPLPFCWGVGAAGRGELGGGGRGRVGRRRVRAAIVLGTEILDVHRSRDAGRGGRATRWRGAVRLPAAHRENLAGLGERTPRLCLRFAELGDALVAFACLGVPVGDAQLAHLHPELGLGAHILEPLRLSLELGEPSLELVDVRLERGVAREELVGDRLETSGVVSTHA